MFYRTLSVRSILLWFLLSAVASQVPPPGKDIDLETLTNPEGFQMLGATAGDNTGVLVRGAGDVNGDNIADVLVLSQLYNGGLGVIYVIYGNATATTADVNFATMINGASYGYRIFGMGDLTSMSGLGDVNGDGIGDIIVGLGGTNEAIVVFGMDTTTPGFYVDDIATNLFTTTEAYGFRINGGGIIGGVGMSVSGPGDINNDGISDILVGAPYYQPIGVGAGTDAGAAFVVFGRNVPRDGNAFEDTDLSTFDGTNPFGYPINGNIANSLIGLVVSGAGDVDNDGVNDIILGAPSLSAGSKISCGVTYVVFGRDTNLFDASYTKINLATSGQNWVQIAGAADGDESGSSVSGAGDVNGDGIDDFLIGVSFAFSNSGVTNVIFGRDIANGGSGLNVNLNMLGQGSPDGFRIIGAATDDYSGSSVSGAGDVNGDGLQDILIGAYQASPTVSKPGAGISYVVYGRRLPPGATFLPDVELAQLAADKSLGFRVLGAQGADQSGTSVSGAGDVNGDNMDDVIIGAIGADPPNQGGNDFGIAYVVFGFPTTQPAASPSSQPTGRPTSQPSDHPSSQPSRQPIGIPSSQPSSRPTGQPSVQPSSQPSSQPVGDPSSQPSMQPTEQPSTQPSKQPSTQPSKQPSSHPTGQPSAQPSSQPSSQPSGQPVAHPSGQPTGHPSTQPSGRPSSQPSISPTSSPSAQPSAVPSVQPMSQPSAQPTGRPTSQPSAQPTLAPVASPTGQPSAQPSGTPTVQPSGHPSSQPSSLPSGQPTTQPSTQPSSQPSTMPSTQPSTHPSTQPSSLPSGQPSGMPTTQPSASPSGQPSQLPSSQPSDRPTAQPSSRPSSQPTSQPSTQPLSQPSGQPSSQPTTQSSTQPSSQPSTMPSTQPSTHPSAQPSSLPSSQPSCSPTTQPSTAPTSPSAVNPSSQPSGVPSSQPTTRPSTQPSTRPSTRPSAQPTEQPAVHPSSQSSTEPSAAPVVAPSALVSIEPSVVPSIPPSAAPTMSGSNSAQPHSPATYTPSCQPTRSPSSVAPSVPTVLGSGVPTMSPSVSPSASISLGPSVRPTEAPTSASSPPSTDTVTSTRTPSAFPTSVVSGEWSTVVTHSALLKELSVVSSQVWACGPINRQEETSCALFNTTTGRTTTIYQFQWAVAVSPVVSTTAAGGSVVVSGRTNNAHADESEVANCAVWDEQLFCDSTLFADTLFLAVSYLPYPNRVVYFGTNNVYVSATIIDITPDTVRSFIYTLFNMKSVVLSQVQSPPNFIGSFVAGTAVGSTGMSTNYIVAGLLRTDSGVLSAMSLVPVTGAIVDNADLVTSTALEITGPDLFIAGALELSDGTGKHAYLLRANALYNTISYCVQYRTSEEPQSEMRRALTAANALYSVTRGVVLAGSDLFLIADVVRPNITSVAVMKVRADSGVVIQQVHLTASDANLTCSDIALSGLYLIIACLVQYNATAQQSLVIAADRKLTFSALPGDIVRDTKPLFHAESVPLKRTIVSVSTTPTTIATTDYQFNTADQAPSRRPSTAPSSQPSGQPSSAPSTQPSSSPTAAPTVSPQPTSTPSTSGPTNTHKPSAAPTVAPSAVPTVTRTEKPSLRPTQSPSLRPSAKPSVPPTTQPAVAPSVRPTRCPTATPSRAPLRTPSAAPVCSPSALPTAEPTARSNGGNSSRSTVIWASVGGALLLCVCGYAGYQYKLHRAEEVAKAERKKEYFAYQALLVAALEKEREEIMQQIRLEDARKEKNKKKQRAKAAGGNGAAADIPVDRSAGAQLGALTVETIQKASLNNHHGTEDAQPLRIVSSNVSSSSAAHSHSSSSASSSGSSQSYNISSLHTSEKDFADYTI